MNILKSGPSPSGRGRRDSLIEADAPGEGHAKREPDRAKPQGKSIRILSPHRTLSLAQGERVISPAEANYWWRKNDPAGAVLNNLMFVVIGVPIVLALKSVNTRRFMVFA